MTGVRAGGRVLTSEEFQRAVAVEGFDDSCARTMGSWYQSPDGIGRLFTALSLGHEVDSRELLDAVAYCRDEETEHPEDANNLDLLASWVSRVGGTYFDDDLGA